MSYILEALKKADQEYDIGAVPDLATPHEDKPPQTHSNRWLLIIVMLLSVNAALVVMLLKDKDAEDAEAPVTAQTPPGQQTAPINDQLTQPIQVTSEPLIREEPTLEEPVQPEREPIVSTGEVVVLPEPVYLQNSKPSILKEEESDMQMDAMTTLYDNSRLQSWYELPPDLRDKLDLPRVDIHVYSEEPQRRFILVNLEKYREGERLASGLVLEEILPDGMVMSYRGERFRVEK